MPEFDADRRTTQAPLVQQFAGAAASGAEHSFPAVARLSGLQATLQGSKSVQRTRAHAAALGGPAAAVVQRVTVKRPTTNVEVELESLSYAELQELAREFATASSAVPDALSDEIQARKSAMVKNLPGAHGALAQAGDKVILAANDMRNGFQGSAAAHDTMPMVASTARSEAAATSAGSSAVAVVVTTAASIATGGLAGKVVAVAKALAQAGRAGQLAQLAAQTQNADLKAALSSLVDDKLKVAVATGIGAFIPFLASAAGKALADTIKDASDEIWYAAMDGDAVARQAALLLGIEVRQVAGTYGSAGKTVVPRPG